MATFSYSSILLALILVGVSLAEKKEMAPDKESAEIKAQFESVLSELEDREATQICIGLSGKADIQKIAQRFKTVQEWGGLSKEDQARVNHC